MIFCRNFVAGSRTEFSHGSVQVKQPSVPSCWRSEFLPRSQSCSHVTSRMSADLFYTFISRQQAVACGRATFSCLLLENYLWMATNYCRNSGENAVIHPFPAYMKLIKDKFYFKPRPESLDGSVGVWGPCLRHQLPKS